MTESFMYHFKIKSRFTGEWQDRSIIIDYSKGLLGINQHGLQLFKYFSLSEIHM